MTSDSVAWQRVVTHVISGLAVHLVRTAHDSAAQPWRITLPEDAPQGPFIEHQLRTILRARPVVAGDSVVYELNIDSLEIVRDTARAVVRTSFRHRCTGATAAGYGNVERVYVARHPRGFWGAARSAGVMHGDKFSCATLVR